MKQKEWYIIQNEEGNFLYIDSLSGGYPCFLDDWCHSKKFDSLQSANEFLKSNYAQNQFKNEFKKAIPRKVTLTLEEE